jgi:hypothetical protein
LVLSDIINEITVFPSLLFIHRFRERRDEREGEFLLQSELHRPFPERKKLFSVVLTKRAAFSDERLPCKKNHKAFSQSEVARYRMNGASEAVELLPGAVEAKKFRKF